MVAPGEDIPSVSILNYNEGSGTSFSTPHVSAMAAIAKCIDEDITAEEFLSILQKTSTPLGNDTDKTYFGYGLINAEGMIDEMLKDTEYFISPIARTSLGTSVKIFNNTNKSLNAKGIAARYENGRLTGFDLKDINLPSGAIEELTSSQRNNVNFMLCDGFLILNRLPISVK